MSHRLTLYTFRISHYSEKIRWMLDVSRIPYSEIRWTPFLHAIPALAKSRSGTSVPIIELGQQVVQDSTHIMLWLDRYYPPFSLLPKDPEQRRIVLDIEERFDRIGAHITRYVYSCTLGHPEMVKELWTLDAKPMQRALVHASFPALKLAFQQLMDITPAGVERSRQRLDEEMSWLEERLAGQSFLVGGHLSVADITAAALLAPLVCPSGHPVYSRPGYVKALQALREPWQSRPAFEWVRRLYEEHRKPRKKS